MSIRGAQAVHAVLQWTDGNFSPLSGNALKQAVESVNAVTPFGSELVDADGANGFLARRQRVGSSGMLFANPFTGQDSSGRFSRPQSKSGMPSASYSGFTYYKNSVGPGAAGYVPGAPGPNSKAKTGQVHPDDALTPSFAVLRDAAAQLEPQALITWTTKQLMRKHPANGFEAQDFRMGVLIECCPASTSQPRRAVTVSQAQRNKPVWQPYLDLASQLASDFVKWREGQPTAFTPPLISAFVRQYEPDDRDDVRSVNWHYDATIITVIVVLEATDGAQGDLIVDLNGSKGIVVSASKANRAYKCQPIALNLRKGDAVVMDNTCRHCVTAVTAPRWTVAFFFGFA